jgi:hypothetical protein
MVEDRTLQRAALAVLFVLQVVMLGALFADVDPHPPLAIPFGGMGPFLGAALAVIVAAWISGSRGLGFVAAALALVSFGPQKYLDPQFALVFPAVLTAQAAVAALIYDAVIARRRVGQGAAS